MAGGNATLKGATLTQGVRAFPRTEAHAVTGGSKTAGKTGDLVFPFAVSFLLPVFVVMLVKEKEEKILIMMKMNGMKTWVYYLSHYLTCFTLYAFSTICFCVAGFLTKIPLFKLTSPVVLAVLFILWGNAQVCLSFFLSTLFKQSRNALVMTYLIALIGVVVATVLAILYEGKPQLSVINMWPPFAFYRGLLLANAATYIDGQSPYEASQLAGNTELRSVCLWLFFDGVGYALLAAYLQAVLPTDFGVQFPWHFPFTAPLRAMERRNRRKANGGVDSEFELAVINAATENLDSREDDDVRAERTRVDNRAYPQDANVVISHMKKVYPSRKGLGPKVGVRDVTFAEESGTILGLLGPNGAGKTTLISILSGLFEASSGEARIAGFDLKTQTSQVYDNIGICPQFDIHWSNLTVEEHLYFYSRLKGIPGQLEEAAVQRSLRQVSLDTLKTRLASQLSGGEKRRLSIAIALVGNPSVIFLDEPTTGLDPEVRRLIWNIIQSNRVGKTIMLTTHSMEEAEALCTRIGIMAKGSLRCIGNPLRLKELYGSGFKLSFISNAEETQRACEFVESVMPTGWRKMDAFATSTAYEFPAAERAKIPAMFGLIEKCKAEHGILQWSISQTTLEEVFVHIISGDDANAD
ncbi:P-loop containing nucleoside triphosphate hydrolase protein [Chytriomyces sp. MP71]|nr:P-loop containing nucleoside triphosphate hydrolase protein [Chytriomyces sp. MP71]